MHFVLEIEHHLFCSTLLIISIYLRAISPLLMKISSVNFVSHKMFTLIQHKLSQFIPYIYPTFLKKSRLTVQRSPRAVIFPLSSFEKGVLFYSCIYLSSYIEVKSISHEKKKCNINPVGVQKQSKNCFSIHYFPKTFLSHIKGLFILKH